MEQTLPSRVQIIDQVVEAANNPEVRFILLTGSTGLGKSQLLDTIADRLGADRIWGTAALSEVPGSSIAHLIRPTGTVTELISDALLHLAPRLCVDDLDKCDPLSQALIERLVREPNRLIIATVRSTQTGMPDMIEHLARDPKSLTLQLEPLDAEELQAFAANELGGQVEAGLAAQLWRRTSGNPLYAAQVLHAARASGLLSEQSGVWSAGEQLPVPASLQAAITDRFAGLDQTAAEAAQWLAGLGRVPINWVELSGRTQAVRQLIEVNLVEAIDTEVTFAEQSYAEVVWAGLDPLRRREILREHVAAERRQANPDPIRLAVLSIEVGDDVQVSSLLAAARLATGGTDVEIALRLAQAALRGAKGEERVEAVALAADALMQLGRSPEAATLLRAELANRWPGPDAVLLAGLLHIVMTWGLGDEAGASTMLAQQLARYPKLTPLVKEVFGFIEADGLVYAGRPADAIGLLDRLKLPSTWKLLGKLTPLRGLLPQVEARIIQSRAHALTQLGRPDEATTLLTTGNVATHLTQLEEQMPSWRGNYLMARSHAAREAGDPHAGLTHALGAWELALNTGFVWGRAWAACNVAASWLQMGDLDQADLWVRRSIHAARAGHLTDCERLSTMMSCVIAGSRGRQIDPDLTPIPEDIGTPTGTGFLHHQYPIGAAWQAQVTGRIAAADSIMAEAMYAAQRDGAALAVAFISHEWIRLGQPVTVAMQLADARTTGVLTQARLALAQGLEARDPHRLVAAADLFELHGMPLFAAEAAALASTHSIGREATALAQRAMRLAATVGSPPTPLLTGLHADSESNGHLTQRERRVAELAVSHTNAEIAAQLTLSRRTVENHLARAYAKLGITSRRELPGVLGLHEGLHGEGLNDEPRRHRITRTE